MQGRGDRLTVTADAYARGVEIRNEDETLRLSDNYFDLNGGSKTVRILSGTPASCAAARCTISDGRK